MYKNPQKLARILTAQRPRDYTLNRPIPRSMAGPPIPCGQTETLWPDRHHITRTILESATALLRDQYWHDWADPRPPLVKPRFSGPVWDKISIFLHGNGAVDRLPGPIRGSGPRVSGPVRMSWPGIVFWAGYPGNFIDVLNYLPICFVLRPEKPLNPCLGKTVFPIFFIYFTNFYKIRYVPWFLLIFHFLFIKTS